MAGSLRIETLTLDLAVSRTADLLAIEEEALSQAGDVYSEERWDSAAFMQPIPRKWDLSVCALAEDGSLAGFFIASASDPTLCHHHRSAVHSSARGQGAFRAMADGVLSRARAFGIKRFSAFASAGHEITEKLYVALGFEPLADEKLKAFLSETFRDMTVEGDVATSADGHRKKLWYREDD